MLQIANIVYAKNKNPSEKTFAENTKKPWMTGMHCMHLPFPWFLFMFGYGWGYRMKMSRLEKLEWLMAVAFLILGVGAVCFSSEVATYIHIIIGVTLMGSGLFLGSKYFFRKLYSDPTNIYFVMGMLAIVLGILTVSVPGRSLVAISVIWGAWSVLKAIHELNQLVQVRLHGGHVILKALSSVVELVFGMVLLMELTEAIGHHVIILGISFLSHGVRMIIDLLQGNPEAASKDPVAMIK